MMEPVSKDVIERIQERYPNLRRSERLVADYLREHSNERLEMSITEFADTLGVSEATVSRFTRALGYKGFADMKLYLAAESAESAVDHRIGNIPVAMHETDSLIETSRKLVMALSSAMGETQKLLDHASIQAAVSAVINAKEVLFMGVGGAAAVCDEAAHLLLKAGVHAISHADGYTQIIAATTANESTTVFGVSHTGMTDTVANALMTARANKAKTICITSGPESPVGKAGEIALITWHHEAEQIPLYGDFLEGRMCQLYIIYLIYLGVLFQTGADSRDALEATAANLAKFYLQK